MKNLRFAGVLSVLLLLVLGYAFIQLPTVEEKQVAVIEKALDKTVMIYELVTVKQMVMKFDEKKSTIYFEEHEATVTVRGSGVFITSHGHILTAAHLFQISPQIHHVDIETFYSNNLFPAKILNISDKSDLALLKIEAEHTPYAQLAYSPLIKVGQEVFAIGNPLGFAFTVTKGIISRINVDTSTGYNFIQSDVAINPGNSGGPLFDVNGKLVGINSRIIPPINMPVFTGIGLAVFVDQIREYLVLFKGIKD
jgi:S1-C subfamily serine protease